MKKTLKLTAVVFLLIFSFSCEKDESELNIESTIEQEKTIDAKLESRIFRPTTCDIIGATNVTSGTTANYSYTNDTGVSSNISWSLTSVNPFGSATMNQSGTVNFSSNFISATILAAGTGISEQLLGIKSNRHIIFYRTLNKNYFEITRILHERMY